MCFIPDIPVLSPLPTAEIPPEQPTIEPEPEETGVFGALPIRIDEYGQEYYPHPLYAHSEEVPMNMRTYINSDDEDDEDMISFLGGYHQSDEDGQMSNHEEDYESEEELMVEGDEDDQAGNEVEEEEEHVPAAPVAPPAPPQAPLPRSNAAFEDRLWRRLQETEMKLKKRDEDLLFWQTKCEHAKRSAQNWEYAARRIAGDYRLGFDYSWNCVNRLQMAEGHQQTPQFIEQVAKHVEKEYDMALYKEQETYKWVQDYA